MADQAATAVLAPAAERGSLNVGDRAVKRIVEAAAREVRGVARPNDTVGTVGSALGRDYPRVECDVAGSRVQVRVEVALYWPAASAEVAAELRDHVRERLASLAALQADTITVRVAKIVRRGVPERSRVQ
ncbi:Asp23/Gls24 family envelope stress response protein [Kineococcus gynurae]|uniref:Asp23/Gls24 family envelope stress response protein n=1 Tax=Kineococcus gynurae TaxID=452979 RepID=A0ABV5LU55_9ACTN